jgi:hypothetical protein
VIVQHTLVELGHAEPAPRTGPGMFALAEPGKLVGLLEDAGFFDIETSSVAIKRSYSSVLDWLGETRDLSRQFSGVWGNLSDQQRQQLRDAVAAAAADFTDAAGQLVLPGSSLAALASA